MANSRYRFVLSVAQVLASAHTSRPASKKVAHAVEFTCAGVMGAVFQASLPNRARRYLFDYSQLHCSHNESSIPALRTGGVEQAHGVRR